MQPSNHQRPSLSFDVPHQYLLGFGKFNIVLSFEASSDALAARARSSSLVARCIFLLSPASHGDPQLGFMGSF